MASNGKKENILTSWKEIAAYLDRDVRTCVRWEQRYGLPVHRLERDSKAKVFAYRDQIDAWLAERSGAAAARPDAAGPRFLHPVPILLALAGLAAAAHFLFLRPGDRSLTPSSGLETSAGRPADFHIQGSLFIAVDGRDRRLWSFDTRRPDLMKEDYFRSHFGDKQPGAGYIPVWPFVAMKDLDGDARPEILFAAKTLSESGEALLCFEADGRLRWSFEPGRALEFGGKPFRNEYRIFGLDVADYDGDGASEVLVISIQKPDWPCQTVLLDAAGRVEGEYWNAGYFMEAVLGDVDGDGDNELVLAGVNNEYRRGAVAIFEAGRLSGHSPQLDNEFVPAGIGEGGQSAYILFPKSDVHAAIRQAGDPVNYFWIHPGDGLTAWTAETQIIFDLDRALAVRSVTLSNHFFDLHAAFTKEGKVHSVLDDRYTTMLGNAVFVFRSGIWTGGPGADATEIARLNGRSRKD